MATILVVDDKALNRSVLTTLLGYSGRRLLEASGGLEAIEKTRSENPELVITDILMPNMDGYELMRRLREMETATHLQVIFYSATYLEDEARTLARACGESQVICKPAEPEYILRVVDEVLAHAKAASSAPPERTKDIEVINVLSNKLYLKIEEVELLDAQVVAQDAISALSKARKEKPDFIVLDLGLPRGDRFMGMPRIKSDFDLMLIPIIVVSARDSLVNEQGDLEAGAEVFFPKPFENDEFLAAVDKALSKDAGVRP